MAWRIIGNIRRWINGDFETRFLTCYILNSRGIGCEECCFLRCEYLRHGRNISWKMDAASFWMILVSSYKTTWRHISEDIFHDFIICSLCVTWAGLVHMTFYGLDCPGFESRWGWDFPHPFRPALGSTSLLYNGHRVISGDRTVGACR